jgi:hypothetical protein
MKIRELIGRNINGTEQERNDGMTEVTEITEQRNGRVWENGLGVKLFITLGPFICFRHLPSPLHLCRRVVVIAGQLASTRRLSSSVSEDKW